MIANAQTDRVMIRTDEADMMRWNFVDKRKRDFFGSPLLSPHQMANAIKLGAKCEEHTVPVRMIRNIKVHRT